MLFVHPEPLGKMISNLTVAYFSNGLVNSTTHLEREIRMKISGIPNIDWLGNPGKFEELCISYFQNGDFSTTKNEFWGHRFQVRL